MITRIPEAAERATVVDGAAAALGRSADRLLDAFPRRDLLRGELIGHVVHPALTDLPIGFWTASFVLDLIPWRPARPVADAMVALGVATAVPTAVTGLNDFTATGRVGRRVALIHAALNTVALAGYTASLVNRLRRRRGRAVAQALLGATAAAVGAQLGGHLVYRLGTGVEQRATSEASAEPRPGGSSRH